MPAEYRKEVVKSRAESNLTYDDWLVKASQRSVHDFKFFCEALLGMRVHGGQIDVVNLMDEKDYGVLAAANGWGKTVFYALLVLWASYTRQWAPAYWQQYKTVVTGPEMKHALLTHNEIEKIRQNRHDGQLWNKNTGGDGEWHQCVINNMLIPWTTKDQHMAFKWQHNNSLLYFESSQERGSAFEGQAYNLVVYDEARREMHLKFIVEEVFLARGVRAPNMKILLGSTPLADSFDLMEYFEKGKRGDRDWWYKEGTIMDNIFIDKDQIEKIRRNLDPRVVDQVLSGKFVEPPESYFFRERVLTCFDNANPEPDIDRFEGKANTNHIYVGGIDPATAEGGDDSVVTIWDVTQFPYRVIFQKVFNGVSTTHLIAYCDVLIQEFGCQMGFDAQGPLGVEFEHNASLDAGWYVPVKFGGAHLGGLGQQKAAALANFRYFVNNGLWKSPNIPELKAELIAYQVKDEHLRKDRLMAQVYAAWVAKDYAGEANLGIAINPMQEIYGGSTGPFTTRTPDKPISSMRREWLNIVEASRAREEAEALAKELDGV